MANVLIVHATRHGQTTKIARRMEAVLRREGHAVQLVDTARPPKRVEVWRFDVTFVGAPMYACHYPASLIRFVRAQQEFCSGECRSSSPSTSPSRAARTDGRSETLSLVERFIEETGWRPTRVELIAGALAYTQYNFFIRLFMRRMARKAGGDTDTSRDHEYTDWPAVERFALEVMDRNRRNGRSPHHPRIRSGARRCALRRPTSPRRRRWPGSSRSMTSGA